MMGWYSTNRIRLSSYKEMVPASLAASDLEELVELEDSAFGQKEGGYQHLKSTEVESWKGDSRLQQV
jgi:hypothetical protein